MAQSYKQSSLKNVKMLSWVEIHPSLSFYVFRRFSLFFSLFRRLHALRLPFANVLFMARENLNISQDYD